MNSTNEKLARKKLAPNLLLLSSHEVDLFGHISKGSLNPAGRMCPIGAPESGVLILGLTFMVEAFMPLYMAQLKQ